MIQLKNVSKTFTIFSGGPNSLLKRAGAFFNAGAYYTKVDALKNINLRVRRGEFISIIGANGSGKTTLLKIIAQILEPSHGGVTVDGSLVPLLELGIGFHPELTAQENIRIYAGFLGISRQKIIGKMTDILAFAEVQRFAHAPLRTFSSGMQARLAFATAIQADPEILLVDEVLAVGDISFQEKCLRVFEEWKKKGKTIIFVSHDLNNVGRYSDRVVLLDAGRIRKVGKPNPTILAYYTIMKRKYAGLITENLQLSALEKAHLELRQKEIEIQKRGIEIRKRDEEIQKRDAYITWLHGFSKLPKKRWGSKEVEITQVLLLNQKNRETARFRTGDFMRIRIFYKVNKEIASPIFGIRICSRTFYCFGTNTKIANCIIPKLKKEGFLDCDVIKIPFLEGKFALSASVHSAEDKHYDWHENFYQFEIMRTKQSAGVIDVDYQWSVQNAIEN